jgi:oxalate decarboxylase/phosphoglucose isomerase-like protein (cupin superfamily)
MSPQPLRVVSHLTWLGHYIENTSEDEELIWIENFKSDTVEDISLTQWLALTPHDVVATVLKIPVEVVDKLKTEKQILIKGSQ